MNLDKDTAAVHAMLSGWSLVVYLTSFDGEPGIGFYSQQRKEWLRTAVGAVITRSTCHSSHMQEAKLAEVPNDLFWRLFDRLILLGLIPPVTGYTHNDSGYDIEDL